MGCRDYTAETTTTGCQQHWSLQTTPQNKTVHSIFLEMKQIHKEAQKNIVDAFLSLQPRTNSHPLTKKSQFLPAFPINHSNHCRKTKTHLAINSAFSHSGCKSYADFRIAACLSAACLFVPVGPRRDSGQVPSERKHIHTYHIVTLSPTFAVFFPLPQDL